MTENNPIAARIEALEMRVAYQDRTIEELNEAISRQWNEIDGLTRQIARLGDQLQEVRDAAGATGETEPPPPHY
ncbi:MAG: SlyX family protein [Pseudolabrys sp.]|nr:SlyX family protein [Pseudolabrys sp.]